ncbi:astacin-like metalloprotease toxin 5 [Uloborus diversus]|uniref:astacin-like metalloprotease toxin 5 n=1 Tax=Uloborus diversus TaxID=327109 RepID=UPI00240988B3|nr:astacin-like metalloprotease toxin 5 [Uloborus diversus]
MQFLVLLVLLPLAWGTPVVKNPMITEGLFEGDIKGIPVDADRNAVPRDAQRWPNGVIPYEVDSSRADTWNLIAGAMKHIQDRTCIRFVRRTTERDYIRIVKENGCWSYWGRLGIGMQKLSLGSGCENHAVIVHELMHAIGFEHEHNRSDRDDYLIINWNNIQSQWHSAFQKLRSDQNRLLTRFDYDSIMMYGEQSFSKGQGYPSMSSKDGRHLPEAYNKPGLTNSDIQRVKILYQC